MCIIMCACAPMYTYICVNACICDVYVYMSVYTCECMYVCIYVCICICICMYICICIYMCVYVCIDISYTQNFLLDLLYSISWLFILLCFTIIQFVGAEQQVEMFILNWHKRTFCPSVRTNLHICIFENIEEKQHKKFHNVHTCMNILSI